MEHQKLELWYFAKPFNIAQKWGVANPSYKAAGFPFDLHNGLDVSLEADRVLHAPCKLTVTDVGFNNTAGNYIRFILPGKFDVLGDNCYVGGVFLHMEKQAVSVGETVDVGSFLGIGDSTGFSTGPHTHLSLYRLKEDLTFNENAIGNRLDLDPHTDHTIDPLPYFNGYYAVDETQVLGILGTLKSLLAQAIAYFKK